MKDLIMQGSCLPLDPEGTWTESRQCCANTAELLLGMHFGRISLAMAGLDLEEGGEIPQLGGMSSLFGGKEAMQPPLKHCGKFCYGKVTEVHWGNNN